MNILRVRDTKILNFKSARLLLSTFFVCAARALLCEWRLVLGGALAYMAAKIAENFPISAKIYYIRARILHRSKLNDYTIILQQVG
jgi:hypothetical protein